MLCVYGYRSQWYMAVGCSFTDISGLACYNYLLVVTVFSAPPFPMELQRQERKSEKKGTGCERAVTAISHTGNEICDNHG